VQTGIFIDHQKPKRKTPGTKRKVSEMIAAIRFFLPTLPRKEHRRLFSDIIMSEKVIPKKITFQIKAGMKIVQARTVSMSFTSFYELHDDTTALFLACQALKSRISDFHQQSS
jgi:hypothetical protein